MARFLTLIVLGAFVLSPARSEAPALQPLQDLIATVKPCVVTIESRGENHESLAQGTGFFVAPDKIVTCLHVIAGSAGAVAHLVDGSELPVEACVGSDAKADIAVLRVRPLEDARALRLSEASSRQGDKLIVIGSPLGLDQTVSEGIVASVRNDGTTEWLQITAPVSHGSSGSPVVSLEGTVIGVVSAGMDAGQNLNFATPAEAVRALLAALPKEAPLWPKAAAATQRVERGASAVPGLLPPDRLELATPDLLRSTDPQLKKLSKDELWATRLAEQSMFKDANGTLERQWRESLSSDPDNADLHTMLGLIHEAQGEVAEAAQCFLDAARLGAKGPEASLNLSIGRLRLGDAEGALAAAKEAIALDAEYFEAALQLGIVHAALSQEREALEAFRRAVSLDPTDPRAHCNLGVVYFVGNNPSGAKVAFSQAIKLKDWDYTALYNLGTLRALEGDLDGAKLMLASSGTPRARFNLGLICLAAGDSSGALAQLEKLRDQDKALADGLLGLIYPSGDAPPTK